MQRLLLAVLCLSVPLAWAGLKTEEVEYRAGDTVMTGYLAYDDSIEGKRPGVLVVHEWWGHNDYARKRAEMQAAHVDYELISYPGAKHGFTNPQADEFGKRFGMPLAYDADADRDSWERSQQFFDRIFSGASID